MKNKIKILQIGASNIGRGGRSTIAYLLCSNINDLNYQFDFLCMSELPEKSYCERIEKKGGKIISYPNYKTKLHGLQRIVFFINQIRREHYDIVHIHVDNAIEFLPRALLCKIAGIKLIIAHGHMSKSEMIVEHGKNLICQLLMPCCCDFVLGCSQEALKHLYSLNFIKRAIIKNGIEFNKFDFDETARNQMRKENGWEDMFVVGHVGRFSFQKNHPFIIEVFKYIIQIKAKSLLLLVGDGEREAEIRNLVKKYNMEKNVVFWGPSDHVEKLLWAMDVFVFPSNYEGFGIAPLEAQAAGLLTYISEYVPDVVMQSPFIRKLELKKSPELWAKVIINDYLELLKKGYYRSQKEQDNKKWIKKSEYHIEKSSKKLKRIYNSLLN